MSNTMHLDTKTKTYIYNPEKDYLLLTLYAQAWQICYTYAKQTAKD